MRLAVGEAAANGRADAGREHRVDRVEVDARRGRRRRPAGTRAPRACTRSIPCRSMSLIVKTRTPSSRDQPALAVVDGARADDRRPHDRRRRPGAGRELLARRTERLGERHAVDVPARRRAGPVHVGVGVDPEHAAGAARLRHPAERAHRDGVVAAEHERQVALRRRRPPTRAATCAQERMIAPRYRACGSPISVASGDAGLDVAPVDALAAEPRRSAPGARRSGSPRAPCRPRAALRRGRARRRSRQRAFALVTAQGYGGTARLTAVGGEVAQLVEHTAENRGVAGSSPALAIIHTGADAHLVVRPRPPSARRRCRR